MTHNDIQTPAELQEYIKNKKKDNGFCRFTREEGAIIDELNHTFPENHLVHIYQGYFLWRSGTQEDALHTFSKARELAQQKGTCHMLAGLDLGVLSCHPEFMTANLSKQYSKYHDKASLQTLKQASSNYPLTVLISCDGNYLEKFGELVFIAAQRVYSQLNIHLDVVCPSDQQVDHLSSLQFNNISVSIQTTPPSTSPAYFASRRFHIAGSILNNTQKPLLITDIDQFPSPYLLEFIQNAINIQFDVCCGETFSAWMPWNRHIVSDTLFQPTSEAKEFLSFMSNYINYAATAAGGYEAIWWVDQNAFFFAKRFLEKSKSLKFLNRHHLTNGKPLFCGPRGIGKTALSKLFADYANITSKEWCIIKDPCDFFNRHRKSLFQRQDLIVSLLMHASQQDLKTRAHWCDFMLMRLINGHNDIHIKDKLSKLLHDLNLEMTARCVQQKAKLNQAKQKKVNSRDKDK